MTIQKWILYLWTQKKSKTCEPYRLLLILSDKINLKRSDKFVILSNFSIYYKYKNKKMSYRI